MGITHTKKIFINGSWGIGKSYYTSEYISEHSENIVYISLFGKTTFDSIVESLSNKMIEKLNNKDKITKKVKNFFSKIQGSISYHGISISNPSIKNKSLIQEFSKLLTQKELIIIIDDLERKSTNIPIEDIMGLIEELSTIEKVKIVLIGDEENINENDKEVWKKFKEKLIEKEHKINCFSFNAIESLVVNKLNKYISEDMLYDFISSFLKKHNVKNLRTINKGINLFFEIIDNYLEKNQNEKVYLVILKNCMAVAIEFTEELYNPNEDDENDDNSTSKGVQSWMKSLDSNISSRIVNHYFGGNSFFSYDIDSSILDYVIKIYNSEIDSDLINEFNKVLCTFIEKKRKKQEKNIFYLSAEQIKTNVEKIYDDIMSETYEIITIEEFMNDLYNLFNWNKILNFGYKTKKIFIHANNILFKQYYDLSKEEYQNCIDRFSAIKNESKELSDFINEYNKEAANKYFKDKTSNLLKIYKDNNLNTNCFEFFKWKFIQPNSEEAKKYFASVCKKNNFLLPKLENEIEEYEWSWTHNIWYLYFEYLDEESKKKLNGYVNKLKKKNKLLEYRINALQEYRPLV